MLSYKKIFFSLIVFIFFQINIFAMEHEEVTDKKLKRSYTNQRIKLKTGSKRSVLPDEWKYPSGCDGFSQKEKKQSLSDRLKAEFENQEGSDDNMEEDNEVLETIDNLVDQDNPKFDDKLGEDLKNIKQQTLTKEIKIFFSLALSTTFLLIIYKLFKTKDNIKNNSK